MINVFEDTRELDRRSRENYGLSEELMMENAAAALEKEVVSYIDGLNGVYLERPSVLILCGKGNNGADGYALARRLVCKKICVAVLECGQCKTEIGEIQKKRCQALGITFINLMELDDYIAQKSIDLKVIVDCIYGSGFHGELDMESEAAIMSANSCSDAFKVACDIPSGMKFHADVTVCMGALKMALFSDEAKEMCGRIVVADLGVARNNFENAGATCGAGKYLPVAHLLEKCDMWLPWREKKNVNKGSFGHGSFCMGEKTGASVLAGMAALEMGAGLCTLVNVCDAETSDLYCNVNIPFSLMQSRNFPENTTAVCVGPGFGRSEKSFCIMNKVFDFIMEENKSCVVDADAFYNLGLKKFLEKRCESISSGNINGVTPTILTPHPKEFASLLNICGLGDYSVQQVLSEKVQLMEKFCNAFPGIVLLVKGANVFVSVKNPSEEKIRLYINPFGNQSMAKAGSGDVLSGIITALLCQKFGGLKAAVSGTLAHAFAAKAVCEEKAWSLTPEKLIAGLALLG